MNIPWWVIGLSTSWIANDMAAADVNGTVTYSGLETLLLDPQSTVAASGKGLTSAEFSDL